LSRVERRDNAARGLDSASAVEFCKSLRTQCDVVKASTCVAIHQAPQAAYEVSNETQRSTVPMADLAMDLRQGPSPIQRPPDLL